METSKLPLCFVESVDIESLIASARAERTRGGMVVSKLRRGRENGYEVVIGLFIVVFSGS